LGQTNTSMGIKKLKKVQKVFLIFIILITFYVAYHIRRNTFQYQDNLKAQLTKGAFFMRS
jgi:cell division protein FtsL